MEKLNHEDAALVEEISRALQPPELSPTDRVRFDAALFTRLEPRRTGWIAGLAWIPAAAAIALLMLAPVTAPEPLDWLTPLHEAQGVVEGEDGLSWVDETSTVLADPLASPDPDGELEALLSDEYVALAYWLDTTQEEQTRGGTTR